MRVYYLKNEVLMTKGFGCNGTSFLMINDASKYQNTPGSFYWYHLATSSSIFTHNQENPSNFYSQYGATRLIYFNHQSTGYFC